MNGLVFGVITLLTNHKTNGRAMEAKGFTQAVFNIALIGKMEQFCVIAENHECGGTYANLCHIVNFETFALV